MTHAPLVRGKPSSDCQCVTCTRARQITGRAACKRNRRWKERHPDTARQMRRDYVANNPEKWKQTLEHSTRKVRRGNKKRVLELTGGRCALCGFIPEDICQIDLHESKGNIAHRNGLGHQDPGFMMSNKRFNLFLGHLDEIVPLCKNCHALVHSAKASAEMEQRIAAWKASRVLPIGSGSGQSKLEPSNTSIPACP